MFLKIWKHSKLDIFVNFQEHHIKITANIDESYRKQNIENIYENVTNESHQQFDDMLVKCWVWSGANMYISCSSRQILVAKSKAWIWDMNLHLCCKREDKNLSSSDNPLTFQLLLQKSLLMQPRTSRPKLANADMRYIPPVLSSSLVTLSHVISSQGSGVAIRGHCKQLYGHFRRISSSSAWLYPSIWAFLHSSPTHWSQYQPLLSTNVGSSLQVESTQ